MHEYAILTWDDVEAAAGRKVPAAATVMVGLDGNWAELDLTAENEERLRAEVSAWVGIGRPVTEPVLARPAEPGARKAKTWKVRSWERGRPWGVAIRAFADERGLGYLTPSGKYYYSKELRDAYAAHIGKD